MKTGANEGGHIFINNKWRSLNEGADIDFHEEEGGWVYNAFVYSAHLESIRHTINTYMKKPI